MPATSSAGGTGRWRCAGAPRGWSRPAGSSAGSTATCTYDPCATHWTGSPDLSVLPAILRPSTPPDDHRAATEVPRNSGHPPAGVLGLLTLVWRDWLEAVFGWDPDHDS